MGYRFSGAWMIVLSSATVGALVIGASMALVGERASAAGSDGRRHVAAELPTGVVLVSRTFGVGPRPAVYDEADGYVAATAPGQRLALSVRPGDVILGVGTKVRLTWSGFTADPPDPMGIDIAAQAVQVRDLRPTSLNRWTFEVVNPYIDCQAIRERITSVDCTGWRVSVIATAVVARPTQAQ